MDAITRLFLTRGRASRTEFWIVHLVSIPIMIAVMAGAFFGGISSGTNGGIYGALLLAFVAFVLMTWVSYATAGRRFHDRKKSAWLVGIFLLIPALFWMTLFTSGAPAAMQLANNSMISLANGLLTIWYIVELGFMGPVEDGNGYGNPVAGNGGGGGWGKGVSEATLNDHIGSLGSAHAAMEAAIQRQQLAASAPRAAAGANQPMSAPRRQGGVAVRAGGAVGGFGKRNR